MVPTLDACSYMRVLIDNSVNGLRKACDQLYFIETCSDDETDNRRWLQMDATRYTPKVNVGSSKNPALFLNQKIGPYFEEV